MVGHIETAGIAHLLDLDITFDVFQLFFNRKHVIDLIHADLKKPAKGGNGVGDVFCPGHYGHPFDGV